MLELHFSHCSGNGANVVNLRADSVVKASFDSKVSANS